MRMRRLHGFDESDECGLGFRVMAMPRNIGLEGPYHAYEPKPRVSHYAGAVRGECFIFAGRRVDFVNTMEESFTIEVFDQYLEQWRQLKTTGSPPKGLSNGGCCVSPSGDLYVYGGWDGSTRRGGLYKLSSSSLKWSQLSGESDVNDGPTKKSGCGMVCFKENKVAVIGGLGPPPAPLQPGASFIKRRMSSGGIPHGRTNEIQIFDTDKCK